VPHWTVDELICVCIARQVEDGEILAQGIATPLVMAGYLLAQRTHAPNVYYASAIGSSVCRDPAPLGLTRVEDLWLGRALITFSFTQVACELLPRLHFKEFFRPGQVDAQGNCNNIFIGGSYARPRVRLPGCGGIADVTAYSDKVYLYVPRHSRAVFVEQLDIISGLGHSPARSAGAGPRYLVSDLGQFDFADGRMRLVTWHPGQSLRDIRAQTDFPLQVAPDAGETEPPTAEEVRLLREEIDPLGIRKLEMLAAGERKTLLREVLAHET